MRWTQLGLATVLVLAGVSSQAARGDIDQLVIFGDSLSDSGNVYIGSGGGQPPNPDPMVPPPFPPTPPYGGIPGVHFPADETSPFPGRFTDGANWVDTIAAGLSLSSAPLLAGGANYAFGGAVTGLTPATYTSTIPNFDGDPFTPGINPITVQGLTYTQQIGAYLNDLGTAAQPLPTQDTLFVIWAGSNDILLNDEPNPEINTINNIRAGIDALVSVGAKQFLIANIPSLEKTPGARPVDPTPSLFVAEGLSGNLEERVEAFNTQLTATIDEVEALNPDVKIFEFNVQKIVKDVLNGKHPAAVLFNNTTAPVIDEEALFLASSLVVNASPADSMFWDGVHPTTLAHQVLGAEALDLITRSPGGGPPGQALTVTPEPTTAMVLAGMLMSGLGLTRRRRAS